MVERFLKKAIWEIVEDYLPTQQILRNSFKNPLVLCESGVLWWDIKDRLEFQDKLELGCTTRHSRMCWSLRCPKYISHWECARFGKGLVSQAMVLK